MLQSMCRYKKKNSCEKKSEGDTWHYLKKKKNICRFQSNNATVAKTRGCWNLQVNLIVVIQLIVLLVLLMSGDLKKKIEGNGTCMRETVSCVHKQMITIPPYP